MKQFFTLICLLVALGTRAQNMYPYSFSKTTGTYQNLTGSTNLTAGFVWDDTTFTIPLGFTFKWALDNRNLTSIVVDAGGMLYATDDVNSTFGFPIPTKMMMAYQCDLVDRGTNTSQMPMSPISYLTTGTAPNRICKIEYRNCGFFSDAAGLDSTNFQIWLYEGSNIIEYHYGPQSVADITTSFDGENGPWINLIYDANLDIVNQTLMLDACTYVSGNNNTANAVNPTSPIDLFAGPSDWAFDGLPDNGQIFRWVPLGGANSVNDLNAFNHVKVYPTPFNTAITIENENNLQALRLSDLNGRVLIEQKAEGKKATLNTNTLASGVYFLNITDAKNNQKTMKVVK
ncbi:MAG: T9SS type A sorting domain-containing protein [Chitinophagaceae bacterium]